MNLLPDNNYQNILTNLKEKIRQARLRASVKVNFELLKIYWEIGDTILEQQKQQGWGAKVTGRLAKDLKIEFPDMRGISERNLVYMQTFASSYPDFPFTQAPLAEIADITNDVITQAPLAQLSWYHHITLLDKVKDLEKRLFYMKKTVENGWSRNVMVVQIESKLHERQGKAITNFSKTLPNTISDFATQTLKSPYNIDFLSITEEMKERDIEKALIQHLKKFMLELGRGFAYVGNQFNVNIGGKDYFLDMLFYNYHLHCFVVFELKIGEFEPEFAGKLNLYINTIDAQIKGKDHKPTIGILLCKNANETVVKYSLKGIDTPMGVAEYKLQEALPKELKGEIPSIAELEAEMEKEYEELKSPLQKKFDVIKEKLSQLKGEEIKQTATPPILFEIFNNSMLPLYEALIKRMDDFKEWFYSSDYYWGWNNGTITNIAQLAEQWKNEEFLKNKFDFYFLYRLNGLKKAATEAFSIGFQLSYKMEVYWYGFTLMNYNNQQPFIKKLYHEQLTPKDIKDIVEIVCNLVVEDIKQGIERIKNQADA